MIQQKMTAFQEAFHVGRPNVGDRESFLRRAAEMFDRNWLSNNGPLVQELESRLAAHLGVRHCIAVCNATVGLEIAIRALGLTGEVILPSLTFVATAHVLQWLGLTPVFCDVDSSTMCLDPVAVERRLTSRTSAILGVHLYGKTGGAPALEHLAAQRGVRLFFDAAHAFGCSAAGRMVGGFGDCEVFSFHATKFFNTFEGGAITTQDDDLARRLRLGRNFGFTGMDQVEALGINGKMSEISAAMGLTNLEALDRFLAINRRNYELYRAGMATVRGLKLLEFDSRERCNWQYIVVAVGPDYPLSRDELLQRLHARKVLVRRYFWPGCHRMEPYRTLQPEAGRDLPRTESLADQLLVFPTGSAVSEQDVERFIGLLEEFARRV